MDDLIQNIYSFVVDEEELKNALNPVNKCLHKTFQLCFQKPSKIESNQQLEIESILDFLHDELNTGHWSEISLELRRAFTAASFVKSVILLQNSHALESCLKTLDLGILLGAPLEKNPHLLTNSATLINSKLSENIADLPSIPKRKSSQCSTFEQFHAVEIEALTCPSLETFNKYFTSNLPVKLTDCVSHWPALRKWVDVSYLMKVAGERTVPIEIGSHYADENWSQKLMALKDFIKGYFLENARESGYLAQHNLFNQIPELQNDIRVPEYCCLGEGEEPDVNAWLGPAGTVSPLHFDPKNNLLVQVFGTKLLVLYSPQDSENLYPHDSNLLFNTAQVDPFRQNSDFPNFQKAKPFKCLLEPGEMLYIPPKWWHYVTALDKSFSVSFWWN